MPDVQLLQLAHVAQTQGKLISRAPRKGICIAAGQLLVTTAAQIPCMNKRMVQMPRLLACAKFVAQRQDMMNLQSWRRSAQFERQ